MMSEDTKLLGIDCFTGGHEIKKWPSSQLNRLASSDAITVEAKITSYERGDDKIQCLVSQWSPMGSLSAFNHYNASKTSGMDTTGYFGAVFDGQYVYFMPQHNLTERHGKVLRYNTHQNFFEASSWQAYDASKTSGLNTKGYYGGVFDGRYIYFSPRLDQQNFHSRVLRYDTEASFDDPKNWIAKDLGLDVSYQGAGFDGRYVYFAPGIVKSGFSGLVLRLDTQLDFKDQKAWATYDASLTQQNACINYDGVLYDGQYIYFIPLEYGVILRYNSDQDFHDSSSWDSFDASCFNFKRAVGGTYDGQYIYLASYASSMMIRYCIRGDFQKKDSWECFDAKNLKGLEQFGYDGAFFDGRYIYYIPFLDVSEKCLNQYLIRYDSKGNFTDSSSWNFKKIGDIKVRPTLGYNAGAFDGRFFYFAPWRDAEAFLKNPNHLKAHGRVLRYDTTGNDSRFSLRYSDFGHNGGLSGSIIGPRFLINTDRGVFSVALNKSLKEGDHHLVGTYDGQKISLYHNGHCVAQKNAAGKFMESPLEVRLKGMNQCKTSFEGDMHSAAVFSQCYDDTWVKSRFHTCRASESINEING